MTLLCVPIFVRSLEQALGDVARAGELGADIAELRLDSLLQPIELGAFALPVIVTCRAQSEGGRGDLPDEERLRRLQAAAPTATYLDIELDTLRRIPEAADLLGDHFIVSAHDFLGRPDRLHNLVLEINRSPAAVAKIVWTARTIRDNLEAFEILQTRAKPTIALCMGEAGILSRILAKKFGAFLTFAALSSDAGTAPGQIQISDLKQTYRWDAIGAATKVYGVVAQPVMHSMSPAVHNAAFDHVGHDGVYLPFLVEGSYESFKAFMESFLHFDGLHLSGLSITLPHKENALRYLRETGADVEPLAERIGAVNTILIARHAAGAAVKDAAPAPFTLRGINTDYAAILDCITDKLAVPREQLKGFRFGVIGAGGTGRTAVAALSHTGATVVVYNRTHERARALAAEFNGDTGHVVAAPIEKLCRSCCDVYINTTSVGMYPKTDASPLPDPPPKFTADTIVFDTIYNPPRTRLLRQADAAGAKTISGVDMFVRQAAAQFQAWTGLPAPLEVMRRVVETRLAR
jgi:3-dehydroquinate dehydratase/shikimate dehydrogenase